MSSSQLINIVFDGRVVSFFINDSPGKLFQTVGDKIQLRELYFYLFVCKVM